MSLYPQIELTAFGRNDNLLLTTHRLPDLNAEQVLIRIDYSAMNPIDVKTAAGLGFAAQQWVDALPKCLGYDAVGEVIAVGADADEAWLGKTVCGLWGFPLEASCYAKIRATSIHELVVLPDGVSKPQAAALPLAGLTAWQALYEHGQMEPEQVVVISAAAGGVGHIAVQLAALIGCKVIALASPERHAWLKALGACQVLDYHQDWQQQLEQPVDLLLDLVGGESGEAALKAVKSGGRVVTVPTLSANTIIAAANRLDVNACGMLVRFDKLALQLMLQLIASQKLTLHIQACYSPTEIAKAHALLGQGHVQGKLLMDWAAT